MLLRSLLFVPADSEKNLHGINKIDADTFIIDLEDAVSLNNKSQGRDLIKRNIKSIHKPIFIRVNSIETKDFAEDIKFLEEIGLFTNLMGVMLPKSNSEKDINVLSSYLDEIEVKLNLSKKLYILPLIETALGIRNAYDIAKANKRIVTLAFGGVDFSNDIGAQVSEDEREWLYARSEMIISSRCAEVGKPIDTVYTDFKNDIGFKNNCLSGRSMGFGGKLLIHPSQVDSANLSYSPTEDEINFAKKVIDATQEGVGAFQLDGKMIDKPVIEAAKKVIQDIKQFHSNN